MFPVQQAYTLKYTCIKKMCQSTILTRDPRLAGSIPTRFTKN
jgi:hypothetical protein